jgi:hypothetical protein
MNAKPVHNVISELGYALTTKIQKAGTQLQKTEFRAAAGEMQRLLRGSNACPIRKVGKRKTEPTNPRSFRP